MTSKILNQLPHMTVYDSPAFPYPSRVRIAIGEKQLESVTSFKSVDLFKGEHKTEEYKKLNAYGKVPVLKLEDGTLLSESTAITEYLDGIIGEAELTGMTPLEKALIQMWTKRAEIGLLDAFGYYFHHSTPGLGPDVESYQNRDWGLHQRQQGLEALRLFDSVLQEQQFVACNRFTMADIALIGGLICLEASDGSIPDDCAALSAWYKQIQKRPSVANRLNL